MVSRFLAALYGLLCYLIFFATFVYAIAFVGNIRVPRSVDVGPEAPLLTAFVIDAILLSIFAIQHSVMARQWFKRAWTKIVPPVIERSTYVLFASSALILLFWQWRPITNTVWNLSSGILANVLWAGFALGWGIVLLSTFLISHFELFGLTQVLAYFSQTTHEPPAFRTPFLYKAVRHPLYMGFIIAFWSTPHMLLGHLFFAFMCTAYMLVAIQFEERDMIKFHGERYVEYRRSVSMIVPMPPRSHAEPRSGSRTVGK
jgi:protein-S-isoprenylcysteine O-methyltransferase Ste14